MSKLQGMQVAEFVTTLTEHCGVQFPCSCTACGTSFASFADYVRGTTPIGLMCFDTARALDDAIGTLSLANCSCGTTISIRCADTGSEMYKIFITALQADAAQFGLATQEVLERLRDAVRGQAIAASL